MEPALEARLSEWKSRLTTISRNVMELQEDMTTKAIRARLQDRERGYTGLTAAEAGEAFRKIDDLWLDYLLLARVVEEADELATSSNFFRRTEGEAMALLDGESVELPSVHVPLNTRDLLARAQSSQRTTPAKVLEAMQEQFAVARDTLARITATEKLALQRLQTISQDVAAVGSRAQALGLSSIAIRAAEWSQERIHIDPLECAKELERAEKDLQQQKALLQQFDDERLRLSSELNQGQAQLDELRDLVVRSAGAIEEARLKIVGAAGFSEPMDASSITSLEEWLAKLQETATEGRWNAVSIGLRRWQTALEGKLTTARQDLAVNRRMVGEREELRGRFQALRAKARAMEQRGHVFNTAFQKLLSDTEFALEARPLDLEVARRALAAFEKDPTLRPPAPPSHPR